MDMSSESPHHPNSCQVSASAALLELVELISSVAGPMSELPVTESATEGANQYAESTVRLLSDLLVYAVMDDNDLRSPNVCQSTILTFCETDCYAQIQTHLGFLYETAQRLLQKIDGDSDRRRLLSEKLVKVGFISAVDLLPDVSCRDLRTSLTTIEPDQGSA